jgi:hypothetical protein
VHLAQTQASVIKVWIPQLSQIDLLPLHHPPKLASIKKRASLEEELEIFDLTFAAWPPRVCRSDLVQPKLTALRFVVQLTADILELVGFFPKIVVS